MARLPGLTAFRDDRPRNVQNIRRSPVEMAAEGPQAPRLTPRAAPVDLYARPTPQPGTANLQRLAEALGALAPSLSQFGAAWMANRERAAEDTTIGYIQRQYGGDPNRVREAIMGGSDPRLREEAARRHALNQMALIEANNLYSDIQRQRVDLPFKDDPVAMQRWIREQKAAVYQKWGLDEEFITLFERRWQNFDLSLQQSATRAAVETATLERAQTLQDFIGASVRSGIAGGMSPQEIIEGIHAGYPTNRLLMGATHGQQDEYLVNSIGALVNDIIVNPEFKDVAKARQYREIIRGLLSTPRQGESGPVPPLLRSAGVMAKAQQIWDMMDRAYNQVSSEQSLASREEAARLIEDGALHTSQGRQWLEQQRELFPSVWTPARISQELERSRARAARIREEELKLAAQRYVEAAEQEVYASTYEFILRGGNPADIRDVVIEDPLTMEVDEDGNLVSGTGKAKVRINQNQLRQRVSDLVFDRMMQKIAEAPDSEGQRAARQAGLDQIKTFAASGMPLPTQVSNSLKMGASALINAATAQTGRAPQAAIQGYEYYRELRSTMGALVSELSEEQLQIYEALDLALMIDGDLDKAMSTVARAYAEPLDPNSISLRRAETRRDNIRYFESNVMRPFDANGWFDEIDRIPVRDRAQYIDRSFRLYEFLERTTGASPEKLWERVGTIMKSQFVNINGSAVPKTPTSQNPLFRRAAERWIEDFAKKNNLDPKNVFISRIANTDTFQLVDENGMPFAPGPDQGFFDTLFTPEDINRYAEIADQEARQAAIESRERWESFLGTLRSLRDSILFPFITNEGEGQGSSQGSNGSEGVSRESLDRRWGSRHRFLTEEEQRTLPYWEQIRIAERRRRGFLPMPPELQQQQPNPE